jgi:ribonuclease P protein component
MFAKKNRVPSYEIDSLKQTALIRFVSFGKILYKKNEVGTHRARIIVAKKVFAKATQRNRLKRVFGESLRVSLQKVDLDKNYDILLMLSSSASTHKFADIVVELNTVFSHLN